MGKEEVLKILMGRGDLIIILERFRIRAKEVIDEHPNFFAFASDIHFDFLEDNWKSKYLDEKGNLLPNFHEIVLSEKIN